MSGVKELVLTPPLTNVKAYEGDAWAVAATIHEPAAPRAEREPLDVTGWLFEGRLRTADGTLVSLDVVVVDGPAGRVDYGQEQASVPGKYDVRGTPPGGLPRTYLRGFLAITEDV